MRGSRWAAQGDSLDLLLDTMCNLFGGIVFVALLIAMLASDGATKRAETALTPTQELIEREIANLTQDRDVLAEAVELELKKSQDKDLSNQNQQVVNINNLQATLRSLREILDRNNEGGDGARMDMGTIQTELKDKLAALENAKISLENQAKSLQEEIKRLQQRMVDLKKQGQEIVQERTRKFRLPRERVSSKQPYWIILKNESIFPVYFPGGSKYREDIVSVDKSQGGDNVEPIPGRGLVGADQLKKLMTELKGSEVYPVFVVLPDSFPKYLEAKEAAIDAGLDYGSSFEIAGYKLRLVTEGGSKPGVQ